MMPKLDGIEVCRRLKADPALPFMPIILVTAKSDTRDVVTGLDAGADEYLTKPIDQTALVARVKSVLRVKALHDQVQAQAADLANWNRTLERRVAEQVAEIERARRLKRFLPPQIADLVLADGAEDILQSHRREVTVVFCDLRGFTAFAETAEPEEVMTVLTDYHRGLGALIHKYEGTVVQFAGDGVMVLFNDPVACPNPCERAVRMGALVDAAGPVDYLVISPAAFAEALDDLVALRNHQGLAVLVQDLQGISRSKQQRTSRSDRTQRESYAGGKLHVGITQTGKAACGCVLFLCYTNDALSDV